MNRATKRPRSPSEFLGLQEAGIPRATCLDFDLAVEQFDIWLEQRSNETVEKQAPSRSKNTIEVPKYRTIAELLGVDEEQFNVEQSEAQRAAAELLNVGDIDDPEELMKFLEGQDG